MKHVVWLLLPICLLAQGPTSDKAGPKFYVVGNVKRPGIYPLDPKKETTVVTAIAASQGMLTASQKHVYIYRKHDSSPNREEIAIDIAKLLNGKSGDVDLLPGDILYLPQSR